MAKSTGWIKLYRKSFDNEMYFSEPFTRWQAWVDLILVANRQEGWIRVRGIKQLVKRGQIGFSMPELAKRWKWSKGKVIRFLNELSNEKQVALQKNNITTLISIIKYEQYQVGGTTNDTADSTASNTANGLQTGSQTDTNNNNREYNKKNKEYKEVGESPAEIGEKIGSMNELIRGMVDAYRRLHPDYGGHIHGDTMWCGSIANFIAAKKGWPKESITNGKMNDVIDVWATCLEKSKAKEYWFTKTIKSLSDADTWQQFSQFVDFKHLEQTGKKPAGLYDTGLNSEFYNNLSDKP